MYLFTWWERCSWQAFVDDEISSYHPLRNATEGQNSIRSASTQLSPALLCSCHLSPAEHAAMQLPQSTPLCCWRQYGSCRELWDGCQVFSLIHKHTISSDTLLMRLSEMMNISLYEKKTFWRKGFSTAEEHRRTYINELLHRVFSDRPKWQWGLHLEKCSGT